MLELIEDFDIEASPFILLGVYDNHWCMINVKTKEKVLLMKEKVDTTTTGAKFL